MTRRTREPELRSRIITEYAGRTVKPRDGSHFDTLCIHAGQEPDPATGAVVTPIYQTSTYVQESLGRNKGYEYARTQNPTRAALEANLAAIESGRAGFAFAPGMAATDAVLTPPPSSTVNRAGSPSATCAAAALTAAVS